jgi:hypothetical protein
MVHLARIKVTFNPSYRCTYLQIGGISMFTLSSIHTDSSFLRYRGAMTLCNLGHIRLYTHNWGPAAVRICVWPRASSNRTIHAFSELQDCVTLTIIQITKYYSTLKLLPFQVSLLFTIAFSPSSTFSILFSSSLPYAKPLSDQNYISQFVLIHFIDPNSLPTLKFNFQKLDFPVQTHVTKPDVELISNVPT